MTDDSILSIFRESSLEQLSLAEKDLLDLETGDLNAFPHSVEGLFRAIHTLKGDAGTLKFTAVVSLCHELETVLDRMRKGLLSSSAALVTDLLAAFDALKRAVMLPSPETQAGNADILAHLKHWQQSENTLIIAEPTPEDVRKGENRGCAVADDALSSIPVRTIHLDQLLERLGEVMMAQSKLASLARHDSRWEYLGLAEDLERQVMTMGQMVLRMRLLPINTALPKYRRLVRDVATRAGKNAELVMSGEFTEIDKSVIEKLNVPIIHLLRNAVRYGIESPEVRTRQGKPAKGAVAIDARQEGNDIIIVVRDDGAGIDPEVIHAKALADHLVRPDAELTTQKKLELVFVSGLSTAATVDDISGRGVGLDAVRSAVAGLNGLVELESHLGQGTAFTIRFPVSLSLMECLRVRVSTETYFFPLDAVEECLELPHNRSDGMVFGTFALRGRLLPLVVLDTLYGQPSEVSENEQIIVALSGGTRFGVAVTEVLGLAQVMVKALDTKVMDAKGFLGAALNDEGAMSLIVDPRGLALAFQDIAAEETAQGS